MAWQQAAMKLRQSQQKAHQVNSSSWHSEDSILLPAPETWLLTGANCYQFRFAKQKRNLLCRGATCHMRTETFITIWTCVPVSTMHSDERHVSTCFAAMTSIKVREVTAMHCAKRHLFMDKGFTITSIKKWKRKCRRRFLEAVIPYSIMHFPIPTDFHFHSLLSIYLTQNSSSNPPCLRWLGYQSRPRCLNQNPCQRKLNSSLTDLFISCPVTSNNQSNSLKPECFLSKSLGKRVRYKVVCKNSPQSVMGNYEYWSDKQLIS